MPDYKEMYLKLLRASRQAIRAMIQAQQECEELYISQSRPDLKMLPISAENKKSMDKE